MAIAPSTTPNVVLSNPTVRLVANIVLGALGIILGTIIAVDGSTNAFDLSDYTVPISVGYAYLCGVFQIAVSAPNVPRASTGITPDEAEADRNALLSIPPTATEPNLY